MQLLGVISCTGANILQIQHDKISEGLNPNETEVHISLEVGGEEHGRAVIAALRAQGYTAELDN